MVVLSKYNLLNSTTLPPTAAEYAPLVQNQIEKYTATGDSADANIATIDSSSDYSRTGKENAKKTVGFAALKDTDAVHDNLLRKLELDMQSAIASAAKYPSISQLAATHGISDTALEIRMASIRDRVEKLPQVERDALLRNAGAAGDALFITAIATTPAMWPLYQSSQIDTARESWIATKSPEAGQKIAAIRAVQSVVKSNRAEMRRHIEKRTGVALPEDDAILRASTGKTAEDVNALQQ